MFKTNFYYVTCNTYKNVTDKEPVLMGSFVFVGTKSEIFCKFEKAAADLPEGSFVANVKIGEI